jgi:RNA polymerase sigma-70 factor (ECF subfamily)
MKMTKENVNIAESEEDVVRHAQGGDTGAFEWLYKTHAKRVYNVCLRITRNSSEAEDLTQSVFLHLFRKIGSFRGESSFSTWLHRVTVNTALMHLRRRKRTEISLDSVDPASTPTNDRGELDRPDTSMLWAVDRINLDRAIRKLPPGYKQLFLLHDVFGYNHKEIVERVSCSIGGSKSQVHRARRRLRVLLQGEPGIATVV